MAFYSKSYKPRTFDPVTNAVQGGESFKVSRSKIDMFLMCERCFYLDRRLGVGRPSMPAFTLNVAVDALLKKEFDAHRAARTTHPLMKAYSVDAIPFSHKDIDVWRENFVGVRYVHKPTNLLIFGAVDDVWTNVRGELMVVDYKATSKEGKVDKLEDTKWHDQYRRQMEVYQWLLRRNGFDVSDTGYFVYVNGKKDRKAFDAKLDFDVALIAYKGSDAWVEPAIMKLRECLDRKTIPDPNPECEYCRYIDSVEAALGKGKEKHEPAKSKPSAKPDFEEVMNGGTLF